MRKVNRVFIALICIITIAATNDLQAQVKAKKHLPKELKKVIFGQQMDKILKIRPNALSSSSTEDFRHVYIEEVDKNGIANIVYYFDAKLPGKPLYEIIVVFQSTAERDSASEKLLGTPNYKNEEWKVDIKADYPLHAWTYQSKLIFVYPIRGSEWNEKGVIGL
ncbi:hypothetical protein [Roseivirga pacifica]|uniref:hypothetical protein n=1 Tax=Roseivirga pacifica TaxID=1267423 RepID=UPI003BB1111E